MKILQEELESSDGTEKTSEEEKSKPTKKTRKKSEPADSKAETPDVSNNEKPADNAETKLD